MKLHIPDPARPKVNSFPRLRSENYNITLVQENDAGEPGLDPSGLPLEHRLIVSIGMDSVSGAPRELAFVRRGPTGHGLDRLLVQLGIKLSRALQGRDPETGDLL